LMDQDGFINDHELFNQCFEQVKNEVLPESQGKLGALDTTW